MKQVVRFLKNSASIMLGLGVLTLLPSSSAPAFAQDGPLQLKPYSKVVPLNAEALKQARKTIAAPDVALASTLPMWNYTIVSPLDGNTYSGSMVGSSPFYRGARTTNIPTYLVPLIIKTPDGGTFDPTALDGCDTGGGSPFSQVLGSPVFQSSLYTINGISLGTGQYVDEFQRANFYEANVSMTGDSYHTALSPITTLPAQTVNIPANEGESWNLNRCGNLGVIDFSTFNSIIVNTVIPSLASQGVSPTSFPVFVMHDVVMGDPGDSPFQNCCVIGFHGASGSPTQTYAVADYDTTGIFPSSPSVAPVSHEVAEWMDDPFGTNPTPAWGNVGQVSGCQSNLEVGDPLSGTLFSESGNTGILMPNGISYYPQELAFFSWFYRESPSMGAGGVYSDSGTFKSGQQLCTN
jgi:hypothetical protein